MRAPNFISIFGFLLLFVFGFYLAVHSSSVKNQIGVTSLGEFRIGADAPHKAGDKLSHPYKTVPPSKFYVYLWHPDIEYTCVYSECGDGGEIVESLRGWLLGNGIEKDGFGVPWPNFPVVKSLILIADADSKIVGIYPNSGMQDLAGILKHYPALADFRMLEGVSRLGALQIGSSLPLDPTRFIDKQSAEDIKRPRFYVYVIHETIWDFPYCPYYECGQDLELIYSLGGWFIDFDHKNPEIIEKFGLDAGQVARGEVTAVVVADSNAQVISIHPNTDMRDLRMILKQHGLLK